MTPSDGASQVVRNAGHLLLAYVLPRVFTVGSVVIAARWLGADRFGAYGAAAALSVMTAVAASAGMMPLLVREIAREPARARDLLASADRVKAVTATVMVALTWLIASALLRGAPEARAATMVMSVGWAAQSFAENGAAYFQAVERMERWTQASALFGLVSATVGVALLVATDSIVAYCWGFTAGWIAASGWLRAGLPTEVRGGDPSWTVTLALLRELLPFAIAFLALAIYCKVDVLILQRLNSAVEVGLYTAVYKFIDVFQALVIVAAGAIYPRLSRRSLESHQGHARGTTAELLLLVSVPVAMALHLTAETVTPALFGRGFGGASEALSRLALLMPMLSLTILGGYVLGATGRMLSVAGLYAFGLAANVALNALLVPNGGAAGAALARLGSEILLVAGFVWVLRSVGAAPGRRVLITSAVAVGAGLVLGALPDDTGGVVPLGAFAVVVVALYSLTRPASLSAIVGVARGVARAPGVEAT